jgi:hypothetical protein
MLSEQENKKYLQGLLAEIELKKDKGKRSLVRINAPIDHNTVHYIQNYFEDKNDYLVEISNNCTGCKNKWDVMIYFIKR